VIPFSYNEIPDAAEHLGNLQQLVASEPRTTLTILNRLDDVKQKLEKDYPRKLDLEDDTAAPTFMNLIEEIEKKVSPPGP
jgi:hypothetical protein